MTWLRILLAVVGLLAIGVSLVAWKICCVIDSLGEDHEWVGF